MGKINQKDIALALKLSRVAVSKALQDHPDIALKTRKLVKDKAKELGYVPNFIGRSLSSKKSYNIGVCGNDSVALGVYKAAAKVGVNIPKDLAVVGYGNLNSGQIVTPALTTYNIPVQEMCYATVDLLVKLINNKPVAEKVIQFDGEIVIRGSV